MKRENMSQNLLFKILLSVFLLAGIAFLVCGFLGYGAYVSQPLLLYADGEAKYDKAKIQAVIPRHER